MLGSPIASNPYAILCFTCLFTFVAAQYVLTMFKYAVFLMLVTAYSLILCQYRAPPPPGFTGSIRVLYDRLVDVAIGVVVVLLLDLILPWYVTTAPFSTPFPPSVSREGGWRGGFGYPSLLQGGLTPPPFHI